MINVTIGTGSKSQLNRKQRRKMQKVSRTSMPNDVLSFHAGSNCIISAKPEVKLPKALAHHESDITEISSRIGAVAAASYEITCSPQMRMDMAKSSISLLTPKDCDIVDDGDSRLILPKSVNDTFENLVKVYSKYYDIWRAVGVQVNFSKVTKDGKRGVRADFSECSLCNTERLESRLSVNFSLRDQLIREHINSMNGSGRGIVLDSLSKVLDKIDDLNKKVDYIASIIISVIHATDCKIGENTIFINVDDVTVNYNIYEVVDNINVSFKKWTGVGVEIFAGYDLDQNTVITTVDFIEPEEKYRDIIFDEDVFKYGLDHLDSLETLNINDCIEIVFENDKPEYGISKNLKSYWDKKKDATGAKAAVCLFTENLFNGVKLNYADENSGKIVLTVLENDKNDIARIANHYKEILDEAAISYKIRYKLAVSKTKITITIKDLECENNKSSNFSKIEIRYLEERYPLEGEKCFNLLDNKTTEECYEMVKSLRLIHLDLNHTESLSELAELGYQELIVKKILGDILDRLEGFRCEYKNLRRKTTY
jgi:hypothetical protein